MVLYDSSAAQNDISIKAYGNALKSILTVEISKSNEDYTKANKLVSMLPFSSDKVKLQNALTTMSKLILPSFSSQ